MEIIIYNTESFGYSVMVNQEIILECLTEEEVKDLTIREIERLYKNEV